MNTNRINLKSRELLNLFYVLIVSIILSTLSLFLHVNERLLSLFESVEFPVVEFVFNSAFLMLAGLLLIAYRRWINAEDKNRKLENIITSINPDALIVIDSKRRIVFTNNSIERLFYYSNSDVLGKTTDLLYFDRRENPNKKGEIYEILESEGFHVGLAKGKRRDGTVFPLEIITGNRGKNEGAVLLLRDISERINYETRLQDERDFNNAILQYSSDGITVFDRSGNIIFISASMQKIFGYSHEEIPTLEILSEKIIPNLTYREEIVALLVNDFQNNLFPERTIRIINHNNDELWCRIKISQMSSDHYVVNGQNITPRILMEKALIESEEKYRQLVERASDGILIISNNIIKLINPKACEIIGYPEISAINRKINEIFDDDLSRELMEKISSMDVDPSAHIFEFTLTDKSGKHIPIEINCGQINIEGELAVHNRSQ